MPLSSSPQYRTLNITPIDDASTNSSDKLSSFPSSPPLSPTSCTSYDFSDRSLSPAPSVYSITSSIREQSYRVEFGRGLNNYSDVYRLPADPEELERLDMQHEMFKEVMGQYVPPLREVMTDDPTGIQKACLDLGCGTGAWIMEVARDFPQSYCVAVDLVPMQSVSVDFDSDSESSDSPLTRPSAARTIPPNCRSEVDDINLGLEHFYGDFDVVHARLIASGIKDYYRLIDQISRVLRPGGLVDFVESDMRIYDLHRNPIIVSPSACLPSTNSSCGASRAPPGPWLARWFAAASHAVRRRGGHIDAAALLKTWISQHKSFEDVVLHDYFMPTAPWMKGDPSDPAFQNTKRIAATVSDDIQRFLKSGRPLLLGSGLPEAVVDELERETMREQLECKTPLLIRVTNVYARKRR